jgi:hypothetical protein
MKNLSILLSLACMFFLVAPIQAQDNTKNSSIGIQFNPYLNSYYFDGVSKKYIFAFRYGFNIKDHLSFGPEVSGYFRLHDNINFSDFHFGGFMRYTLLPTSRIRPFLEFSPYYSIFHYEMTTLEGVEHDMTYFSGYLSPGISLYTKNRKFSLDLMYKFMITDNPDVIFNKSVFSYRLNFNF